MILYTVIAMISVYLYKIIETVSVSVLVYSYKYRINYHGRATHAVVWY